MQQWIVKWWNSETLNSGSSKQCNINSEIRHSATLNRATLNSAKWGSATSNSVH